MTHMRGRLIGPRIRQGETSVLLLGPRQVGKSTLCRSLEPDLYIDLADQSEFLSFSRNPALLRQEVEAIDGRHPTVVVDEIQRIPSLLNTVQSIVDRTQIRFVLTGSSARKLKRGGANLLPGRVVIEHMDPLSVLEIDDIDIDRALRLGTLPGIYLGEAGATNVLETYADVYLREEIQAEALTRNLGGYARFLDTVAIMSGQWVNYSKLSSDAEIPKETARRFIQLLEDTLVAFRLPPFRPTLSTSRRLLQRERILLFDVGVRNALLGIHRRKLHPHQIGAAFEQWVMLQAIYLSRALRTGWKLSTYRTEAGVEVDLVIDRGDDLIAIEIKSGKNVTTGDARGLASLQQVCERQIKKWIFFQGTRRRKISQDVVAIPVLAGLRELAKLARSA